MNKRSASTAAAATAEAAAPPRLSITVEWADIVKADGDVLVAGQYMGLMPQNALLALDELVSGTTDKARLALTSLSSRGAIRNAVGDVSFFPCRGDAATGNRHVVLVGMGRQGFFTEPQLVKAVRCMAEAVGRMLRRPRVCVVLIGTGAGNLDVDAAVGGMLTGFLSAMAADPLLEFAELRIVERNLDRAYAILEALRERAGDAAFRGRIKLGDEVIERPDTGGVIPTPFGFSLMLASIAQACATGEGDRHASARAIVADLPAGVQEDVLKALKALGGEANLKRAGLKFLINERRASAGSASPDRVSFYQDGRQVRTAAMTNLATVTERVLAMKCAWIEQIVERLSTAVPQTIRAQSANAYGHLIHPDVREKMVSDGPLVIEVDRRLARVPWEMLHDDAHHREPLAIHRPVARQLRTTYSPRFARPPKASRLRAAVIGDPQDNLPWAREEAVRVAALMLQHSDKMEVDLYLGSAQGPRPEIRHASPADLFAIMEGLQGGRYDMVHFAGHATFSESAPDLSGWMFSGDDVLTPAMLENVDQPPALIFANACLSAAVSSLADSGTGAAAAPESAEAAAIRRRGDALLVASLADEFLRRGVADYIGTAWEVADDAAADFATHFYGLLLEDRDTTLGQAVQAARKRLYRPDDDGAAEPTWAAYQHYGDPTRQLLADLPPP